MAIAVHGKVLASTRDLLFDSQLPHMPPRIVALDSGKARAITGRRLCGLGGRGFLNSPALSTYLWHTTTLISSLIPSHTIIPAWHNSVQALPHSLNVGHLCAIIWPPPGL